jgi:hypothetical protein
MVYRLRETIEKSLGALLVARRARTNPNRCQELAAMLRGWDGQFTILMRKRIARHIESCQTCDQERRRMVNPVALLGAAPVFIPAPRFLRDRTLDEIQLTCSGTGMTNTAPTAQRAHATQVDRRPQTAGHHTGYDDADEDERRKRKLVLLIGLFAGVPLAVLVLTISWVYLPDRDVDPSGVTFLVPPSPSPAPVGPVTAVAPPHSPPPAAPTVIRRPSTARVPDTGIAPKLAPTQQPNVVAPQPALEESPPPPLPNEFAPQLPMLPNIFAPQPGPAAPPLPNVLAPQPPVPDALAPLPAQQPPALATTPPPSPAQPPPGLGDSGLIAPETVAPALDPVLIPPPR